MVDYLILIFVLLFFDEKTFGMYVEYVVPLIFGVISACFAVNKPIMVQLQLLALGFFVSYFVLSFISKFIFDRKAKKYVNKEIEIPFDIHKFELITIFVDDMPFLVKALSDLKEGDVVKVVKYQDYVLYVDKIGGK